MPRKSKQFKSKMRDAAKAISQGKKEEAHKLWQEIDTGRKKNKADKLAQQQEKNKTSAG